MKLYKMYKTEQMSIDTRTSELVEPGKLRTRKLKYHHQYVRLLYGEGGKGPGHFFVEAIFRRWKLNDGQALSVRVFG
jgi:hypothetical protein